MILKIVGAIWMIGPFVIFATSDNVTGELALGGVVSFFMGLAAFNYKSKEEKEFKKPSPIPHKIIRKPKAKIETFVSDTYLIQKDPVRYLTGSPGEVSRVLSENYYRLFYNGSKTPENALKFLEYRANSFDAIAGTDLNRDSLKAVSNKYYNKVSTLIFFLCYHENYFVENNIFTNDYVSEVYKIVIEEHNKMCPEGQEEINEFTIELFYDIKEIYTSYNSTADSIDYKNIIDSHVAFEVDDDDDDDDDDYDYSEENDIKYTEVVFNDDVINRKNNIFWIDKLENIMFQETEAYIVENQLKGNPLGGLMIMDRIQRSRDNYKNQLMANKIKFNISDEDIEYIISKVNTTVHNKFIEL